MAYTKIPVVSGDVISSAWGNHIQTQYDEAIAEMTTEKLTRIPVINADVDGSEYPVGVTTMDVSTTYGYPARGVVLNFKNNNLRFGQLFMENQLDGGRLYWRDWHTNGWSSFKEVAEASILVDHMNDTTAAHGATSGATANRIARRNADGNLSVGDATINSHAVSRSFGDGRYARTDQIARFSRVDVLSGSASSVDLQVFRDSNSDQIAKFRLNGNHTFRLEVNDGSGLVTAIDFNR